jgi:hypothetical protein
MSRVTRYVLGTLILSAFLSVQARAEDPEDRINLVDRDARSRTLDNKFWALASLSHAAAGYDVHTTMSALNQCGAGCFEANRLMRPFVGSGPAAYSFTLGLTSVSTYATYRLKQKGVRWWWVPMVTTTMLHVAAGIRNQNIRTQALR